MIMALLRVGIEKLVNFVDVFPIDKARKFNNKKHI